MSKIVKLKYDFDTARSCEIKHFGAWVRVTPRQFRSYDGERRISFPINYNENGYELYEGPVYLFQTNVVCKPKGSNQILYTTEGDPRDKNPLNKRYY